MKLQKNFNCQKTCRKKQKPQVNQKRGMNKSFEIEKKCQIFNLQGDSSKMGQTLRLNPCFNTVPTQLCFQITMLTNAVVCLHSLP